MKSYFYWICRKDAGKVTGSCRKTPEIARTWKEAVFRLENDRSFSGEFLLTSSAFRKELARHHRKKSEKFPAGILLPQNHRNYPEPAVSEPDCSTWVALIEHWICSLYRNKNSSCTWQALLLIAVNGTSSSSSSETIESQASNLPATPN
jgi:hypothetical protein